MLESRPDLITPIAESVPEDLLDEASHGHREALEAVNFVDINLDALNIIQGEDGRFANIKDTQLVGQKIGLKLPGFENSKLLQVETSHNLLSQIEMATYTGIVDGEENSRFVISVSEEEGIVGSINIGQFVYNISPLANTERHIVNKIRKSHVIQNPESDVIGDTGEHINSTVQNLTKQVSEQSNNHVNVTEGGGSSGIVKILFYAASDVSNPFSLVSNIIAESNSILAGSGVSSGKRVAPADVLQVVVLNTTFPHPDPDKSLLCNDLIIGQMLEEIGVFSNISQDLDTYGADMAFTLTKGASIVDNCRIGGHGVTYGRNDITHVIGQYPYAVASDNYATSSGDLTGTHEIGHVLGGSHTIDFSTTFPIPIWARGFTYASPSLKFQTIMGSYSDYLGCDFNGPGPIFLCERIAKFSSGSMTYQGITIGNKNRRMSYWLETSMPVAANWTGNPTSVPATPVLSTHNDSCYGYNDASWNDTITTTEYKLYKSQYSNFSSPSLIYNGTNNDAFVNVSSGTWYLRVKACNAAGCSAYSNQETAFYFNGCL